MPAPYRIVIDGKEYPCSQWKMVEKGKPVKGEWKRGFWKGAGAPIHEDNEQCFMSSILDLSSPPFVRVVKNMTTGNISGIGELFNADMPLYSVAIYDATLAANVVYLFNGSIVWKYNKDTNALIYRGARANVLYGQPVLFGGTWRIPRGDKASATDATTYLDAVNLIPINGNETTELHNNTITANVKARHFGIIQDEGVSKIARAFANSAGGEASHRIELASAATSFTPSPGAIGFQVGEGSYPITDLLESQGELLIIKPDGPYRFDAKGNPVKIQSFVRAGLPITLKRQNRASNSVAHGPYGYWLDESTMWRILGDNVLPVGFESDSRFFSRNAAEYNPTVSWTSAAAYGRWLYASRGATVYQHYIQDDGTLLLMGSIVGSSAGEGVLAVRVALDDAPTLWVLQENGSPDPPYVNILYRLDLLPDGSTREALGTTREATSGNLFIGSIDSDRPDRLKQLRKLWFVVEGMTAGSVVRGQVQLDGAASAQWGADITTNGLSELIGQAGSGDIYREFRPGFQLGTDADARVRAWGYEARLASVYHAAIPLTADSLHSFNIDPVGALKRLRDLESAQGVQITAPGRNGSFLSHIMSVAEETVKVTSPTQPEYNVDVLVEAFDIEAGTN